MSNNYLLTHIIVKTSLLSPEVELHVELIRKQSTMVILSHTKSVKAGLHPAGGKCRPYSKFPGRNSYKKISCLVESLNPYMSCRNMIFHSIPRSLDSFRTFFNFLMSKQKKYDYVGTGISFFFFFFFYRKHKPISIFPSIRSNSVS